MLIYTEITPNPQSLKFVLPPEYPALEQGTRSFGHSSEEELPPGVSALLAIPGVEGVFLARSFVTITKAASAQWSELIPAIKEILKAHLVQDPLAPSLESPSAASESVEVQIQEVIETYIRPAIAMDGGDVTYLGYSDGTVRLRLQGSCVGCPSSMITLKAGIEALLKRLVPEVVAVVAE